MDPQRDVFTSVASLPAPTPIPPAFPGKQQHLLKRKDTPGEEIWFLVGREKAQDSKKELSGGEPGHAKSCQGMFPHAVQWSSSHRELQAHR